MNTDNKQTEVDDIDMILAHDAALATLNRLFDIADDNNKVDFYTSMAFIMQEAAAELADVGWTELEILDLVSLRLKAQADYQKSKLH